MGIFVPKANKDEIYFVVPDVSSTNSEVTNLKSQKQKGQC